MSMAKSGFIVGAVVTLAMLTFAWPAAAARFTDVLDAVDGEEDPIDFSLGITFKNQFEWGRYSRERNEKVCTDAGNGTRACTQDLLNQPEIEIFADRKYIELEGKIGMWHDLEFHFMLPVYTIDNSHAEAASIWRKWYWSGTHDADISYPHSRPSLMNDRVIGFPAWNTEKAGFGDMMLGIVYGFTSDTRDSARPQFNLGLDITIPSGGTYKPKMQKASGGTNNYKGDASGIPVGESQVVFSLHTELSRRYGAVDPYFGLRADLPVGVGKYMKSPANKGSFALGLETVAFEMKQYEEDNEPLWKVAFDWRLTTTAVGRGQGFYPLVDGMTWRANQDSTSAWPIDPRQSPSYTSQPDVEGQTHVFYNFAGTAPDFKLPTHDSYLMLDLLFGFYTTFYHYLTLTSQIHVTHKTAHFIAMPDSLNYATLRPADKGGYYVQIEEIGSRVRYERDILINYNIGLALTY